MKPLVTLTSYNLGNIADEADFNRWVDYVCATIDAACGFEVHVDATRFKSPESFEDVITHATWAQEDTIRDAIKMLWERGCRDQFQVDETKEPG